MFWGLHLTAEGDVVIVAAPADRHRRASVVPAINGPTYASLPTIVARLADLPPNNATTSRQVETGSPPGCK